MTSFSDLILPRPDDQRRADSRNMMSRGLPTGSGSSTSGGDAYDSDPVWKKALHAIGKTEEIKTKALGQLLTNDPKYNNVFAPSSFDNQLTYTNLFESLGVNRENLGETGPWAATALGVAAAIADPTEWLNKLRVMGLTKKGHAAAAMQTVGKAALKNVNKGVKGAREMFQLDRGTLTERLASLRKDLAGNSLDKANRKGTKRNVKGLENALRDLDENNKVLRGFQESGTSIDELMMAPNLHEQSLRGQRKFLGFTSPTRLDQLALLTSSRLARGPNAQSVKFALPSAMDAAIIKAGGKIWQGTGHQVGRGIKGAISALSGQVAETAVTREVEQMFREAMSKMTHGNIPEVDRELENIFRTAGQRGVNVHSMLEIMDTLEGTFKPSELMVAKDALNKFMNKHPDALSIRAAGGVKLGKESDAADLTPGSRLTEDQKLLMTPSGLDPDDITRAMDQFETTSFPLNSVGHTSAHEMRVLQDYVVIKAAPGKLTVGDIEELDGIYGQRIWKRHETPKGTYLIQRRLPQAAPIGKLGTFTHDHLDNLEAIAAQLAVKGKTIQGTIHPSDILITPYGGVQIVNPDIIADAKSANSAALNSARSLDSLATRLQLPMGPSREFHHLKSGASAKNHPKGVDGMKFRVAGAAEDTDKSGLLFMGGHDLLAESGNGKPYLDFLRAHADGIDPQDLAETIGDLRDWDRAQGIEFERKRIRQQLQAGKQVMMEPVQYMVSPGGRLEITNGRNRVAAALMEGLDSVPVQKIGWMGEVADASHGHYIGATHKLTDVFDDMGSVARDGFTQTSFENGKALTIAHPSIEMLSADYRLLTPGGQFRVVEPGDLNIPSVNHVMGAIEAIVTRGPEITDSLAATRVENLTAAFNTKFGDRQSAALALAEMAEQAEDGSSFIQALEKESKIRMSNSLRPGVIEGSNQFFEKAVRPAAKEHLDGLARKGVLTDLTVADPRRRRIASESFKDTVVYRDDSRDAITLTNSLKTSDELKKTAEDLLNSVTDAAEVTPYSKLTLEGAEGVTEMEAREFVTRPHPLLKNTFVSDLRSEFSPERLEALKAKGILHNPKRGDLGTTVLDEAGKEIDLGVVLGRSVDEHGFAQFARPNLPYVVTRSGDLFVHTGDSAEDVRVLLGELFGEANQYYQEYGIIGAGRVTVSNPLGGLLPRIGKAEVNALRDRLKVTAQRFTDMGLAESTNMVVLPPFEPGLWESMYGRRKTIGDVLSSDFKLPIPKNLVGHVPDHVVQDARFLADGEAGQVAFKTENIRVGDNTKTGRRLDAVMGHLRDVNDEAFFQEALKGLPVTYHEGYVSRQITPEARKALNKAAIKWQGDNAGTEAVKNTEPFFKQRMFSDIRTTEINAMIKHLGDAKVTNPEEFVTNIIKTLRKDAEIDESSARALYEISRALPTGTDLFMTDPIYVTSLRWRQGQEAVTRKGLFDELSDKHVMWSGGVGEYRAMGSGSKEAKGIQRAMETIIDRIDSKTAELNNLNKQTPDLASAAKDELAASIQKMQTAYGRLEPKHAVAMQEWTKGRAAAGDIDWDSSHIFISGEDARKLLEKGTIKAEDVSGDAGQLLVKVPFKKYAIELEKAGTKVALFAPEVAQVVDRYFGTTTKTGFTKFLKFWDHVTEVWKSWVLFPIPSYHVRNGVSNTFMAWLGGHTNVTPFNDAFKIFRIQRQHRMGHLTRTAAAEALDSMQFANSSGQVFTGKQLYSEFVNRGGLSGGLHHNEFAEFSGGLKRSATFDRIAVEKGGLTPSSAIAGASLLNNPAIRGGLAAAAVNENFFRFGAFIDSVQKGLTIEAGGKTLSGFEAAMMQVKKVFYDYSDLNMFERSVLKRVIPFYSWSRHNIPRMLTTLLTKPVVHYRVAEMARELEQGIVDPDFNREEDLPEWVRKQFGIVIDKAKDGSYWVKTAEGFFPMTDAFRLFAGGGFDMLGNGITPFVKIPYEQIANLSAYSGNKIEQFEGQRARSFTLGAAGFSRRVSTQGPLGFANVILNESLFSGLFRAGKEVTKVLDSLLDNRNYSKEKGTVTTALIGTLIGRAYKIDPDKTRAMLYRDWKIRFNKFKSMHRYYLSVGDTRAAKDTMKMMTWMALQNAPSSER